jgi:hypothetical protein
VFHVAHRASLKGETGVPPSKFGELRRGSGTPWKRTASTSYWSLGGPGRGRRTIAAAALAAAAELAIHGIALRPGETTGLGHTRSGVPVTLLAGSPAACVRRRSHRRSPHHRAGPSRGSLDRCCRSPHFLGSPRSALADAERHRRLPDLRRSTCRCEAGTAACRQAPAARPQPPRNLALNIFPGRDRLYALHEIGRLWFSQPQRDHSICARGGIAPPAETARKGNKRGLYEVAATVALAATAKPSRAAQSARGIGCTAQIPSASPRAQAANSDTDSVAEARWHGQPMRSRHQPIAGATQEPCPQSYARSALA